MAPYGAIEQKLQNLLFLGYLQKKMTIKTPVGDYVWYHQNEA